MLSHSSFTSHFFLGVPLVLYAWRVTAHPFTDPFSMSILFAIIVGGSLFLPRWLSNLYNLAGDLFTRRMISRNQLPSWRLKIPFPFVRIQMGKIMILGLGGLTFSQYYLRDAGSDVFLGMFTFVLLLVLTTSTLQFSNSREVADPEVSLEERKEFALQAIRDLNPNQKVQFFTSPHPIAYVNRDKVFISEKALQVPLGDLKRLLYHEYAHTTQKRLKYFLVLGIYLILIAFGILFIQVFVWDIFLLTDLPMVLGLFALMGSKYLPLWYFLAVVVPFFSYRWIIWDMELDAEKWACTHMGKEEYSKAVAKTLESIDKWKATHGRIPGFGWDRFYYFYPPIIYQVTKALEKQNA